METIYQVSGYKVSTDYERLADEMQKRALVCLVDYEDLRDVAKTIWSPSKDGEGLWQLSARGTCYIYGFNRADFLAQCQKYHVEVIVSDLSAGSDDGGGALACALDVGAGAVGVDHGGGAVAGVDDVSRAGLAAGILDRFVVEGSVQGREEMRLGIGRVIRLGSGGHGLSEALALAGRGALSGFLPVGGDPHPVGAVLGESSDVSASYHEISLERFLLEAQTGDGGALGLAECLGSEDLRACLVEEEPQARGFRFGLGQLRKWMADWGRGYGLLPRFGLVEVGGDDATDEGQHARGREDPQLSEGMQFHNNSPT